jgi:TfoX/Sxy family transcriptional regulator of competence genes
MIQEEFIAKILELLSPMPDITAIKSKGHIVLYNDGVMFGKIIEKGVLLLSNGNKFIEVDTELITRLLKPKNQLDQSDCDAFLLKATKSWWLAKSKIWTISTTKGFLEKT